VRRLHPTLPARLAVYALFAFLLGLQAFFAPQQDRSITVVTFFCIGVSVMLALAAIYFSFSTPAPLTAEAPPSASTALVALLIATWVAPFHYAVFYFALLVLGGAVAIAINGFHLTGSWLAMLVVLDLGACFLLEYLFLYVLRVAADSVPAPLRLPADQ
jgi:hypothetical protein